MKTGPALRLGAQKAFGLTDRTSFSQWASLLGGEAMERPERQGGDYEAPAAIGASFSLFGREGIVTAEASQRCRRRLRAHGRRDQDEA